VRVGEAKYNNNQDLDFRTTGKLLSPIDLIPDFVPILGYLDDLILLPLGISIVILAAIPPALIYIFLQKYFTRGLVSGSVKD